MSSLMHAFSGTRNQTPEDRLRLTPAPAFAPGDPVPGLNSWVLERKLGGGGFGEVWLARHAFDDEQELRAVKFCTDPRVRRRLVTHERNVVVRVMKYAGKHPNIVRLRECNLDGDVPWLMYEFIEGGTLAELIGQWRDWSLAKRLGHAVPVLRALAGALAACHRLDPPLIHRDLKPQNVLMAGPVPRITDFGIGGVTIEPRTGTRTVSEALVPSALRCAGTRLYAPPEQMLGAPPDPRDDVYALGVIAYQSVTGDLRTLPGADLTGELTHLQVPDELASLIARSVALNPDLRPKDGSEWEAGLGALSARLRSEFDAPESDPAEPLPPNSSPVRPTECPALGTETTPAVEDECTVAADWNHRSERRWWVARVAEGSAAAIGSVLTAGFLVYFVLTNRAPGEK